VSTETKAFVLTGLLAAAVAAGILLRVHEDFGVHSKPKPAAKVRSIQLQSIVRLVRKGHTFCSGTVIDRETILTAGHCVTVETLLGEILNREDIEIRGPDNKPLGVVGHVKNAYPQLDRGIIKGNFSMFPSSLYISSVPESIKTRYPGAHYISCGYPMGGSLYCTVTTYLHDFAFCIAVHGVLIPGMSGGPTMLPDGTVIAINNAVEDEFSVLCPIYGVDDEK